MASSPTVADFAPPRWKRIIVQSLMGGTACGVILSLCLVAISFYWQHPKGWDKKAIRASNVKAEPLVRLAEKSGKFVDESSGIIFTFDLENTTSEDITVPKSVSILGEDKNSHALHGSLLKTEKDVFIPSHHSVTMFVENDGLCVAQFDPKKCFEYFSNDSHIVLLDSTAKLEIRIPVPELTIPSGTQINFSK
jgi:hypothetical protein